MPNKHRFGQFLQQGWRVNAREARALLNKPVAALPVQPAVATGLALSKEVEGGFGVSPESSLSMQRGDRRAFEAAASGRRRSGEAGSVDCFRGAALGDSPRPARPDESLSYKRRTIRPIRRRSIAPRVARPIDLKSKLPVVTVPQPMRVPMNPPRNAPTIPKTIVTTHPEGSRPGTRNLASVPATRPRRIQYSQSGIQ